MRKFHFFMVLFGLLSAASMHANLVATWLQRARIQLLQQLICCKSRQPINVQQKDSALDTDETTKVLKMTQPSSEREIRNRAELGIHYLTQHGLF